MGSELGLKFPYSPVESLSISYGEDGIKQDMCKVLSSPANKVIYRVKYYVYIACPMGIDCEFYI